MDALGIIPACAGNTGGHWSSLIKGRDHPRVCGEHSVIHSTCELPSGSSPRVRGTHVRGARHVHLNGIIPACAGNTDHRTDRYRRAGDHPRVCGEHPSASLNEVRPSGSSPRVRGTLEIHCVGKRLRGIIPACAGNTLRPKLSGDTIRDHPRVCGEHQFTYKSMVVIPGSSPRVRGTQAFAGQSPLQGGIIPACAGNTPT